MCGFFGVYSHAGGVAEQCTAIALAGNTLIHRGPDDEGFYADENFGVHFRRLAIIELSPAGHQPMMSADGRYVMVYNGELYNHRELREELMVLGHKFLGNSDSEVLLAAFEKWGEGSLERLRGMFACLIWDTHHKTLRVFRDRLGIKPLYLFRSGEQVLFASEIKAILAFAPLAATPNERTIFKYLARGWADDAEETFYAGVTQLQPGVVVRIENGNEHRHHYWQPPSAGAAPFEAKKFRENFARTVSLHLRSDVPLAATLSGGMDSSSIVALAAKEAQEASKIQAFSVVPPQTVDESFWIDCTVKETGVRHAYLQPNWDKIPELFDEVLRAHDEPFLSSSCVYQYLLRRAVAEKGVKVLLVGEGGDEVLGGYRRLFFPYLYALQTEGRTELFEAALDGAPAFLGIDRVSALVQLANYCKMINSGVSGQENLSAYALLEDGFVRAHQDLTNSPAYPPLDDRNRLIAHLVEHLTQRDIPYVLRMEDRNSMAHGIEARVPFLDHCFLEYVFSKDYAEFMSDGVNKSMLRRAMQDVLPNQVIGRRDKSPRPGSNVHFMYEVMCEKMRELLASDQFKKMPWWRPDCAEEFERDQVKRDGQRAEVWFRFYTLARWVFLQRKSFI